MAMPNPVPRENCSQDEAIKYLETHIENQQEQIERIQGMYEDAEKDSSLRGWAMDRAIRHFEKAPAPVPFDRLKELSDQIYEYAKMRKPE